MKDKELISEELKNELNGKTTQDSLIKKYTAEIEELKMIIKESEAKIPNGTVAIQTIIKGEEFDMQNPKTPKPQNPFVK